MTRLKKWIVTLAVAIGLLASPCLSVSTLVGTGTATALISAGEKAHIHHGADASTHDHRDDGGSTPDEVVCCKLCNAWLSGRQGDDQKAFRSPFASGPDDKLASLAPTAFDSLPDLWQLTRPSWPPTVAPDFSAVPVYLITGRFRI